MTDEKNTAEQAPRPQGAETAGAQTPAAPPEPQQAEQDQTAAPQQEQSAAPRQGKAPARQTEKTADREKGKQAKEDTAQTTKFVPVKKKKNGAAAKTPAKGSAGEGAKGGAKAAAKQADEAQAEAKPAAKPAAKTGAKKARDGAPFAKPTAQKKAGEGERTPEQSEAERQRLAEMTRTVQVSVERLLAQNGAELLPAAEETEAAGEAAKPAPLGARLGWGLLRGIWGVTKWLLLVLLIVALIAAVGVYLLWRGASEDMLPRLDVTLQGQELLPTAYEWHVPVVNDLLTRSFAETLAEQPMQVTERLTTSTPEITVVPAGYDTQLTVKSSAGKEVFTGTLQEFKNFVFSDNGTYTASLVVGNTGEGFAGSAEVTGTQTYDFRFEVSIRPMLGLSSDVISQGEIVALMVNGVAEGQVPAMESDLTVGNFIPYSKGWIAYLPIANDQEPGRYSLRVHTDDYVLDIDLTVRDRDWGVRDYNDKSRLTALYLGRNDAPRAVRDVLSIYDETMYWAGEDFASPFVKEPVITLPYGTVEYVGRSASQRASGEGEGRSAVNYVYAGRDGADLRAPAAGRVLLAEELEGDKTGNTIVIEHGGGIKSIFYGMQSLKVQKGDIVTKGQIIATTSKAFIAEMRVNDVPVDPAAVWNNECNALRLQ